MSAVPAEVSRSTYLLKTERHRLSLRHRLLYRAHKVRHLIILNDNVEQCNPR
jgi:hypothetical protein